MDLQNFALLFSFSHALSINVLKFGDPKNISSDLLKIGNISDDTYEIYLGPQNITFPIGRDWSLCYRWFIDQIRFTDPGMINIHLKIYKNLSDSEGTDENIQIGQRYLPNINWKSHLEILWEKKYRSEPWYYNLMDERWKNIRPQYWRSFCHTVDWNKRKTSLVGNGEKLYDETFEISKDYLLDEDGDWPKAEIVNITLGPKLSHFTSGKAIGTFTDFHIFSTNIRDEKAVDFTGL